MLSYGGKKHIFSLNGILEDKIRIFFKNQNSYLKAIKFNQIKPVTTTCKVIKIQRRGHSGSVIHSTHVYQVFTTCQTRLSRGYNTETDNNLDPHGAYILVRGVKNHRTGWQGRCNFKIRWAEKALHKR